MAMHPGYDGNLSYHYSPRLRPPYSGWTPANAVDAEYAHVTTTTALSSQRSGVKPAVVTSRAP